ncbi:MAG: type III pantothenate kinase [candidate division WOR-3 bacterium]|nr:type III pantothenate kinase [candidate division WOR-3 bacterium]
MIGVIDIGNTNIHCGLFINKSLKRESKIDDPLGIKEFFKGAREILSISVVPEKEKLIHDLTNMEMVPFPRELIQLNYDSEPGADRLANGLSAMEDVGLPVIVVDSGSAITIDDFSKPSMKGYLVKFNGGAILPGLKWFFSSLSRGKTLPKVGLELKDTPGRSTEGCIKFGGYGALVGGIKEILNLMDYKNKKLIFTGGDGSKFSKYFNADYDPFLTLKGGIIAYHHIR